jgi:hypothetical protein
VKVVCFGLLEVGNWLIGSEAQQVQVVPLKKFQHHLMPMVLSVVLSAWILKRHLVRGKHLTILQPWSLG